MRHIGLFEGIGGFSLAAKWMGWKTIAWCEINPFGQQVLKHHYPEATGHGDIKTTDFSIYRGQCDILTGGFPCQPFSTAGKRKGTEDDRHLWPEMLRAIREIQPQWIVGENVGGLVNWSGGLVFEQVQTDLETEGYEVQPFILPAAGVNAPHRRDRVWFIAFAGNIGRDNGANNWQERHVSSSSQWVVQENKPEREGREFRIRQNCCTGIVANACSDGRIQHGKTSINVNWDNKDSKCRWKHEQNGIVGSCSTYDAPNTTQPDKQRDRLRRPGSEMQTGRCDSSENNWHNFPTQPPVRSRNDGVPSGLSGITVSKHRNESLKAYGNAIVPQVVLQIFKAIQSTEAV